MKKFLIIDADGILTDGKFLYDTHGKKYKNFGVNDSLALQLFHEEMIVKRQLFDSISVMTGDRGTGLDITVTRLNNMRVEMNVYNFFNDEKPTAIDRFFVYDQGGTEENPNMVYFIGDDIFDAIYQDNENVMFLTTVNAPAIVKEAADIVSKYEGGSGGLADLVLRIMEMHGLDILRIFNDRVERSKEKLPTALNDRFLGTTPHVK